MRSNSAIAIALAVGTSIGTAGPRLNPEGVDKIQWLTAPVTLIAPEIEGESLDLESLRMILQSSVPRTVRNSLEFAHYFGDWLPSSGGAFDQRNSSDPSQLPTLEKLDSLQERLLSRTAKPFPFAQLVDPGTKFTPSNRFSLQYLSAHTEHPFKMRVFREPKLPAWWGGCDRLALSNLNPHSHQLLAKFQNGVACENVNLTRSDLEDTLSFFHRLPDDVPTIGKNRGNISEPEAIDPYESLWESVSGQRPMGAKDFLSALTEHVKPGKNGLMFDESSAPGRGEFSAEKIWNRPIFSYELSTHEILYPTGKLSPWLLVRFAEHWLSPAEAEPIVSARVDVEAKIPLLKSAFEQYLTDEFYRRAHVAQFELTKSFYTENAAQVSLSSYEKIREQADAAMRKVHDLAKMKLSALKTRREPAKVRLQLREIVVNFPRERTHPDARANKLSQRTYWTISTAHHSQGWTEPKWFSALGSYPPDLIRVPRSKDFPDLSSLAESLVGCMSLDKMNEPKVATLNQYSCEVSKTIHGNSFDDLPNHSAEIHPYQPRGRCPTTASSAAGNHQIAH